MKNKKLHHIKSSGFTIPENYFDAFEKKLQDKIQGETSLAPNVSSGFKTPEGYFETLESNIFEKVSVEHKSKVVSLINRRTLIYVSGIAAAIVLLLYLWPFDNQHSFDTLEMETVENYVLDENFSSYEIASLLTEEELHNDITVEHKLNEEHIQDYLLENADLEVLMID